MSKVDWSDKADSTHVDADTHCFYKKVDGKWMLHVRGKIFTSSASLYNGETDERNLIERPQPKPWSGPEDGLPPVGLKCMHGEEVVEILAHRAFKGHEHDPLLVVFATADDVSFSSPCCFRPIAREDQIAADQRESAIRELMDVAGVDCRVTAARLVDAGFKREVV